LVGSPPGLLRRWDSLLHLPPDCLQRLHRRLQPGIRLSGNATAQVADVARLHALLDHLDMDDLAAWMSSFDALALDGQRDSSWASRASCRPSLSDSPCTVAVER
jgi:hypothetical protein